VIVSTHVIVSDNPINVHAMMRLLEKKKIKKTPPGGGGFLLVLFTLYFANIMRVRDVS